MEACDRRARVGNPSIPEKPKAHFLGGFGGERPKDFRPLGYDGDACLVGQSHSGRRLPERLPARRRRVEGWLRVQARRGSPDEIPKRHFRDQEGRGEVVRLGFNSVFRRLKWLQRIVNLAPNDQFPVLFDEIMAQLVTDRKTDSARRQTRARGRMEQNENALVPMKLDAPMKLRRVLAIECLPRDKRGRNRPATRACI